MSQTRSSQTASLISRTGRGLPPPTPPISPKKGLPPPTPPISPVRPRGAKAASEQDPACSGATEFEKACVPRVPPRLPVRAKSCGKLCMGSPARSVTASASYADVKGRQQVGFSPSPTQTPTSNTSSPLHAKIPTTWKRSASTPALPEVAQGPAVTPKGCPLGASWPASRSPSNQHSDPFCLGASWPASKPADIAGASWPASKPGDIAGSLGTSWPASKEGAASKEPRASPNASNHSSLVSARSDSKHSSGPEDTASHQVAEDYLLELLNEGPAPTESNLNLSLTSSISSYSKKMEENNLNFSLTSSISSYAALHDTTDSANLDKHDVADSQNGATVEEPLSPTSEASPFCGPFRTRRSRPWRISQEDADAERAEADQILAAGADVAGAAGVNVRALVLCMLAQECLDEHHGQSDGNTKLATRPTQDAVDSLRQVATNAATLEDIQKSSTATMEAFEAAGLADALRGRLKRPNVGKHDICHRVLPGLWLGSWMALNNDCEELRRRKVTHVVSVVSTERSCPLPSFIRNHLHVLAHDSEDAAAGLSAHFPKICAFVDAARKEPRGIVYIHCGAGISRGPTVVASYLMWKLGVPAAGALDLIKRARPNIRPNLGFIKQLRQWEADMLAIPK